VKLISLLLERVEESKIKALSIPHPTLSCQAILPDTLRASANPFLTNLSL